MKTYLAALMTAFCLQSFAEEAPPLSPQIALDGDAAVQALDDSAFAADDARVTDSHKKVCEKVNLDDKQKADLKDALFAHKKDKIQLRAALKLAALEYGRALGSATTEKGAADRAATVLSDGVGKLVVSATTFVNDVFFRILKPEQREAGLDCLKAKMKHRHHGRRHHGHHHGHHHHGGGEHHEGPELN